MASTAERTPRIAALFAGVALALGACGSGGPDVAAEESDITPNVAAACASEEMTRAAAGVSSLVDLVAVSDAVAEVEVTRRYEEVGERDGDVVTDKLMAELRVTRPFFGTADPAPLTVYLALVTQDPAGNRVVLAGDEAAAAFQPGQAAVVGLSGPVDGEYELTPGTLLIEGDTVGALCPARPENLSLQQQVATMSPAQVRTALHELSPAPVPGR